MKGMSGRGTREVVMVSGGVQETKSLGFKQNASHHIVTLFSQPTMTATRTGMEETRTRETDKKEQYRDRETLIQGDEDDGRGSGGQVGREEKIGTAGE